MRRNLKKAYEEYKGLYKKGLCKTYLTDEEQIKEMCKEDPGRSIGRALQVGIALGYRLGQKSAKA